MIRFPLPGQVYIDTSVVPAALYPDTTNAQSARDICEELSRTGTIVCFADVLRIELGRGIRRMATVPGLLPADVRDTFELEQWGTHPLIRQRWLSNGVRRFSDFLYQFVDYIELPFDSDIWTNSIAIMAVESLDAIDALHLATARSAGVGAVLTADFDFRRITWPAVHLIRDE